MSGATVRSEPMPSAIGRGKPTEFGFVRISRPVTGGSHTYPAGTRGVVVHCHNDGIGYEVEFEHPFRVVMVPGHDLVVDQA